MYPNFCVTSTNLGINGIRDSTANDHVACMTKCEMEDTCIAIAWYQRRAKCYMINNNQPLLSGHDANNIIIKGAIGSRPEHAQDVTCHVRPTRGKAHNFTGDTKIRTTKLY